MDSIISFLKKTCVFQHAYHSFLFSICFIFIGCAKPSEESQQIESSLACASGFLQTSSSLTTQNENMAAASDAKESNINLDPDYDSFIIQFQNEDIQATADVGLKPSGNPIREYTVAGVRLSRIQGQTYSLNLKNATLSRREVIEKISRHRAVKFVEPDYPIYQEKDASIDNTSETGNSNDLIEQTSLSRVSQQWALTNVQTSAAWQITRGARDIVVAVVDSGIDYSHADLKNNIWSNPQEVLNGVDDDGNGYIDDIRGWNFVDNNNNPKTTALSNHGTHVAGIIGASGNVLGISQKVKLLPLRFIDESGAGSTSTAIRAIDYAISKKVFAINNSWGSASYSRALQDAITRAERAGILFVVAVGNGENGTGYDISSRPYYPASFGNSNILRVAATKTSNLLTNFSNYSDHLVDVAAPGSNILSTITGNKYMKMSGTSMATPVVTGLAVLVKAANPLLNAAQVRSIITNTVDVIPGLQGFVRTSGRVNAAKAVRMASLVGPDYIATCP